MREWLGMGAALGRMPKLDVVAAGAAGAGGCGSSSGQLLQEQRKVEAGSGCWSSTGRTRRLRDRLQMVAC